MNKQILKICSVKNFLILVFVSILLIMPASATTYDLYPTDAPGKAADILQNQAKPGDTFFFHAGTYTRNELGIPFTYIEQNDIVIEGENLSTVAFDLRDAFEIHNSGVILKNIRFIPVTDTKADLDLRYSSDCIVKNCEFNGKTSRPCIYFYNGGSNHTLIFNQIKNNTYAGIWFLRGGTDNRLYLNNFVNNTNDLRVKEMSNAVFWHSPEPLTYTYNGKTFTGYMGNYWDKYTGVDANGDGIGDTPYNLGNVGQDDYPLMAPFENYAITESPSELYFEPSDTLMAGPGDTTEMQLLIDELPEGFSSYVLTLNVTDPEVARISGVSFPAWADTTSSTETPAASVEIKASDPNQQVEAGASNVTLATIDLEALGYGTANITVNVEGFKDDSENPIVLRTMEASLKIPDSDWPEFQKDSSNSGYGIGSAPIRDPKVLWQNLTSSKQEPCGSGGINVPPVVSGNTVFVTAGNASVWAFNKDTGDLFWSKELGGNLVQTSTPALGDGKLFVPTLEGDLYALDPENGNEIWKTHITDGSLESPLTYSDHKLYIVDGLEGGNGTKYYYCYDDNGSFVWKHENTNTAGFIWNGAVVVGNYLVYPVFEGKMVCLEKDTGTFVDEVDFSKSADVSFAVADPGMFRSSVTYANGALYTSSERGQEKGYCFKVGFNPDTGQFQDSGWAASIGFSTSTPVVYDGRIYVGHGEHGETGSMFCLNDSDGSVIWETPISGGVKSSPVISVENGNPHIYFTEAISDGSIYCLNPDGTLAWHYNPPADEAYTLQGAALSDDKVYYGTDNGYLYCIGQGEASNPTANFSSNKRTGSFPLTISFKDRSVNANKFLWDFGDGNTSTEVNPVHTYTAEGTYTVTLTVQNDHGTDTKVSEEYIYAVRVPKIWPVKSGESIQAAINAASPEDIIKVYPGEYHEVLTINKALTLKGIRDPVLNASGFTGSSGITVSDDDVGISGFKITGTEEMCFAITVTAKNALIEDNLIDNCAEGVWLQGTENTIRKNNISNCWDFAAVLDAAGGNRIYQNTFINNNGAYEGSSSHISGGSGSFFQSPEQVEYLWNGEKLTGYMGNYYDDYTGSDSNGDGIGDTAYAADKGIDQYPLVIPYSNYVEEQENNSIPEDSWFQFHGKIDHLGYSESGPKTNRTEWISEDIDAISSSSPVVAEGKIFVICGGEGMEESTGESPQLVALNKSTGNVIWKADIPSAVYGSWASPAYDNGMVFTATGPELGSYNAETGEKLWSFNNTVGTKGVVNNGPAVADGMVIFSDWDGSYYYCLDEYTGYLLWSFEVVGDAQSVPVYADGKFYLTSWQYGTDYQGHAYCVDAVTGEQIWHINVEQSFCGSPAYKDGVLYLTTYNFYGMGDLLALNASDGSRIWQQEIQSTDSTPALAYGNVYVCGGASGFGNVQTYCFNATTGESVWSTTPKASNDGGIGDWTCSVAVADGLVYVGTAGDGYFGYMNLYALDALTGNVVWHAPYAGSSPALSDGMLFSIGGDQKVYAFKDSLVSPVADFSAEPISGDAPLTVSFTDQSTGSPSSWSWDFGDRASATEQNVSHTYTEAGSYTVNLTVSNAVGSDSETKTDYIVVSSQETPDTTDPVIDSADLFPANTTAGSTINISVNATDNKEVTEVTADNITLVKDSDGIWQGSINAPSEVGSYSLSIKAKDATGNTVETSVPYRVLQRSGGANIAVSPRSSTIAAGNNVSLAIKVKNTQNIDDTFKVRISVSELPAAYQANLSWFDWTENVLTLKAGQEVLIPVKVNVPDGIATGRKLFRAYVNSETSTLTGYDTGYLVIS